jgi:hypothetical protein
MKLPSSDDCRTVLDNPISPARLPILRRPDGRQYLYMCWRNSKASSSAAKASMSSSLTAM